jgi:hypothetical protein
LLMLKICVGVLTWTPPELLYIKIFISTISKFNQGLSPDKIDDIHFIFELNTQ